MQLVLFNLNEMYVCIQVEVIYKSDALTSHRLHAHYSMCYLSLVYT